MSSAAPVFNAADYSLRVAGLLLTELAPSIDAETPNCGPPDVSNAGEGWRLAWSIADAGRFVLTVSPLPDIDGLALDFALEGATRPLDAIGLRFGRVPTVTRYLRNGYTSWDGSFFVEVERARDMREDPRASSGHAVTALVSQEGSVAVMGFLRHDRFQSRVRFGFEEDALSIDVETLLDRTGEIAGERLVLLAGTDVEETLRRWARHVARESPLAPRVPRQRICGWCSWYSLYAAISEPVILEHLRAAARFRDTYRVPFDVFQIDDGFAPEMGDWLEVKPQFPRGMKPLLDEIRAAGFRPGLWIAPWMVGNRSRLYAEHPDWVVSGHATGRPLAPMTFYGEFRWHKRSEEYYVLDITHPEAERYIRQVFRTWRTDWGCSYFKTDFMYFGSHYAPAEARWHEAGLSRIQIWMRMASLIREEIGDALWMGCGGPIWASIGLTDAVRIGRDIGVAWKGHYSAESLLRDQTTRNFANGIFWQSDPDCILLRERFHHLTDDEVRSLAMFAGLAGGVLMTSDQLDELPDDRRALLAQLARESVARPCDFPLLGRTPPDEPVLVQQVRKDDGSLLVNFFNIGDASSETAFRGVRITLPPHASSQLTFPVA
jgi:alpha-galactosidase